MLIDLTDREMALCIAALEHAAEGLREGKKSADKLGIPATNFISRADEMIVLKKKLENA